MTNIKVEHFSFSAANGVSYEVDKRKENYFEISKNEHGHKTPLTHKESFRPACNIAKLLADAYREGRESMKDN